MGFPDCDLGMGNLLTALVLKSWLWGHLCYKGNWVFRVQLAQNREHALVFGKIKSMPLLFVKALLVVPARGENISKWSGEHQ